MYCKNSYEDRLLYWLSEIDAYMRANRRRYGLFGGGAVAAYIGHFPRKLHDIDLLVLPNDIQAISAFLASRGFEHLKSTKSTRARFLKFVLRNHIYELIVSIFPGEFTLLDVDSEDLKPLGVYDFSMALEKVERRQILSLAMNADGIRESVDVDAVPLEDLILSKLWPTFEPNTVHDLLLLLTCPEISKLRWSYLQDRIEKANSLRPYCLQTLQMFERSYRATAWYRLSAEKSRFDSTVVRLRAVVDEESDPTTPPPAALEGSTAKEDRWHRQ